MNWYNLVFYHVFKRYYKDNKYKNDIPWLTATGIISVPTFFLLTSVFAIIYYLFVESNVPQIGSTFTIFGLAFTVINYLWFTYNKRYLSIYEHYKTSATNNRRTEILSWLYIILGFASLPLVALLIR